MKSRFDGVICVTLILCMIFTVLTMTVAFAGEEQPITVFINEAKINFDVNPITEDNRTLVPMRYIFEALGATVTWDEKANAATAKKGDDTIVIAVDSTKMSKNGQEIILDVPARLIDDRTLVPVRAVSEGLGAKVEWDENNRQVKITNEVPEAQVQAITEKPTATDAPTTVNGDSYKKLSDKDMQDLKDSYSDIRYDFEQRSFPDSVLKDNADIIKEINLKSDAAKQFAYDVWIKNVTTKILRIQVDSDTSYTISSTDKLQENYMYIVKEAGLEASSYFDVSFETLKDNSTLMLLTFQKTDTQLACKYIGVVVKPDKTVKYFTAESDPIDTENLYFCEVTADQRGTIGPIKLEKSDFINAINTVTEQKAGVFENR